MVKNETTSPGEAPHIALLLTIWSQPEFEGLSSFHDYYYTLPCKIPKENIDQDAIEKPRSYFVSSCGGALISIIRQYIEQQQTPG